MKFVTVLLTVALASLCFITTANAAVSSIQALQTAFAPTADPMLSRGEMQSTFPTPTHPYHEGRLIADVSSSTGYSAVGLEYYTEDGSPLPALQITSVQFSIYNGTNSQQMRAETISTGITSSSSSSVFYGMSATLNWDDLRTVTLNLAFRTTFSNPQENDFGLNVRFRLAWASSPKQSSSAVYDIVYPDPLRVFPHFTGTFTNSKDAFLSMHTSNDISYLNSYTGSIYPLTASQQTSPNSLNPNDLVADGWTIVFPFNLDVMSDTLNFFLTGHATFSSPTFSSPLSCTLNDISVPAYHPSGPGNAYYSTIQVELEDSTLTQLVEKNLGYVEFKCTDVLIYAPRDLSASVTLEPAAGIESMRSGAKFYAPLYNGESINNLTVELNSPRFIQNSDVYSLNFISTTGNAVRGSCGKYYTFPNLGDYQNGALLPQVSVAMPFLNPIDLKVGLFTTLIASGSTQSALVEPQWESLGTTYSTFETYVRPNFTIPSGETAQTLQFYVSASFTGTMADNTSSSYTKNLCAFSVAHYSSGYQQSPLTAPARGFGTVVFPQSYITDRRAANLANQQDSESSGDIMTSPWRLNMKSTSALHLSVFHTSQTAKLGIYGIEFDIKSSFPWQLTPWNNSPSPTVSALPGCWSLLQGESLYSGASLWNSTLYAEATSSRSSLDIEFPTGPFANRLEFNCTDAFYFADKSDFLQFRNTAGSSQPVPDVDKVAPMSLEVKIHWVSVGSANMTIAAETSTQSIMAGFAYNASSLPVGMSGLDDGPAGDPQGPGEEPGVDDPDGTIDIGETVSNVLTIVLAVVFGVIGLIILIVIICVVVCCCCAAKDATTSHNQHKQTQELQPQTTMVITTTTVPSSPHPQQPQQYVQQPPAQGYAQHYQQPQQQPQQQPYQEQPQQQPYHPQQPHQQQQQHYQQPQNQPYQPQQQSPTAPPGEYNPYA